MGDNSGPKMKFLKFLDFQPYLTLFHKKYLGFQFKKWLTFNSNVNSSWKQEALNGDYEYVGMSKFDEPYFKRSYGGKDVFLSLWGPEGKRMENRPRCQYESLLVIYEKTFRKFWNSSQWMVSK